ncbi:MAG: YIP1 family protein [Gammaproteobacteria bacterium]|nr:YIP1 family protein [Gammaproteobacteria bacterium]
MSRIFYRPSEVFAAQKLKRTWVSVLCLVVVLSHIDLALIHLISTRYVSIIALGQSEASRSRDETGSSHSSSAVGIDRQIGRDTVPVIRDGDQRSSSELESFVTEYLGIFIIFVLLFGLTTLLLIYTFYFRIVGGLLGLELKLNHWLALVAWSHVPGKVLSLAVTSLLVVSLYTSSELFGDESTIVSRLLDVTGISIDSVSNFLNYRTIANIWPIVLLTIGFRDWSGRSVLFSFVIAVAPYVLFLALLS